MSHEPFDDPVLGRVTWNPERRSWTFSIALGSGRGVGGSIDPDVMNSQESDRQLHGIRGHARWLTTNEPSIRHRIADELYANWRESWYDPAVDRTDTIEGFRETIALNGADFGADGTAYLEYDDGNLFGGHLITLVVDSEGRFLHGPDLMG